jgi:coenzyme F420-0:L-glutamate ligase/coenzyme F420-1:gamma-L-glutamate ligase
MARREINILGLEGIPEIEPGDDLCGLICKALDRSCGGEGGARARAHGVRPQTIFVVAQKIVSKAERRIVRLDGVIPSTKAKNWAARYQKDARVVEVVLREAQRIVRMDRGIIVAETRHGFICANAGVDASNAPDGTVILLPENPDLSAVRLRRGLEENLRVSLGVIVSDTFGRPWRQGLTNVALGVSGLVPFVDYRGQKDGFGRILQATVLAVADELASAAELVMGKTLGIPVALVEGFQYKWGEGFGRDLIRPAEEDLFR